MNIIIKKITLNEVEKNTNELYSNSSMVTISNIDFKDHDNTFIIWSLEE